LICFVDTKRVNTPPGMGSSVAFPWLPAKTTGTGLKYWKTRSGSIACWTRKKKPTLLMSASTGTTGAGTAYLFSQDVSLLLMLFVVSAAAAGAAAAAVGVAVAVAAIAVVAAVVVVAAAAADVGCRSRNSNQTIGNYSCLWEGGGADKAAVDFSCVRFRLSTTVL